MAWVIGQKQAEIFELKRELKRIRESIKTPEKVHPVVAVKQVAPQRKPEELIVTETGVTETVIEVVEEPDEIILECSSDPLDSHSVAVQSTTNDHIGYTGSGDVVEEVYMSEESVHFEPDGYSV